MDNCLQLALSQVPDGDGTSVSRRSKKWRPTTCPAQGPAMSAHRHPMNTMCLLHAYIFPFQSHAESAVCLQGALRIDSAVKFISGGAKMNVHPLMHLVTSRSHEVEMRSHRVPMPAVAWLSRPFRLCTLQRSSGQEESHRNASALQATLGTGRSSAAAPLSRWPCI
jgi:hypothetical protein